MLFDTPVYGTRGMVACAHYLATRAGLSILEAGGNAIDAAIAANLAMTVVYPSTCSAGGDLFILFWDVKGKHLHALNGSGRAPEGLTPDLFSSKGLRSIPERGALSINVPGAVDGWFEALERFGSLPIEQVFAPAIEYAESGAPITAHMAAWIGNAAESILKPWGSSSEIFLPQGRPVEVGDLFLQPNLAQTYRLLAREGRDAFYRGPIGAEIVRYVQECGGVLSEEDLKRHRSDWVAPISASYRGYEVYEFPPNSQGIAALEMLNVLEGYDLASLGYGTPEYFHLLLEAKKLAFADRDRYISDPDFVDIPVEHLISKEYASLQRQRIDLHRASPYIAAGLEKDGDTMYLCVADRQGNVVSLIQSLFNGFGSGIVGGDTGVLMHNRGSYFSLDPRHVNYLQPGKRTMHTLTPAMVMWEGQPYLVLGSMGGDAQPQIHVQILSAILDFGKNIQEAINAPRWRSGRFAPTQGGSDIIQGQRSLDGEAEREQAEIVVLEKRFPPEIVQSLDLLGHHTITEESWGDGMGHAQAIRIHPDSHIFEGGADLRCDGLALGW